MIVINVANHNPGFSSKFASFAKINQQNCIFPRNFIEKGVPVNGIMFALLFQTPTKGGDNNNWHSSKNGKMFFQFFLSKTASKTRSERANRATTVATAEPGNTKGGSITVPLTSC